MSNDERTSTALRVLSFNPRIRGVRRTFRVRTMCWQGSLWLVAKDVGTAIGWHPDTFRHRRGTAVPDDAWGYATVSTIRGGHMMTLVHRHALIAMLQGSAGRQARRFLAWLNGLAEVVDRAPASSLKSR